MSHHRAAFAPGLSLFLALLASLTLAPAAQTQAKDSVPVNLISFSRDFEATTDVAVLYTVPQGFYLVVTDIVAYWWGEGPAQRIQLYDQSDLKGSFLVFGRSADCSRQGSNSTQVFSSSQSGLIWGPGTPVRLLPSTTHISVTLSGYLIKAAAPD